MGWARGTTGRAGSALRAGGRLVCCAALVCVAGLAGVGSAAADTLYATGDLAGGARGVIGYTIRDDGSLVPAAGALHEVTDPGAIVATPGGRYLYVVDGIKLLAFGVGANGALSLIDIEVVPDGPPSALAVTPNGQWLYATHPGFNSLSAFKIELDGELSAVPGSPFPALGSAPVALAATPDSRLIFVANSGSDDVSPFEILGNGALSPTGRDFPEYPRTTGHRPSGIVVAPAPPFVGRLYVANEGSDNVSAFELGVSGLLFPVPGSPFATMDRQPTGLIASPDGQRLYVANGWDATVSAFTINRGGRHSGGPSSSLTLLEGSPFDVPGHVAGPIVVTPNGRWLYTTRGPIAGWISGFALNADPPYLSDVKDSPYPALARGLAVAATPPRCAAERSEMVARGAAGFRGTPRADVIIGDSAGNRIDALGGGDLICAAGGRDRLLGRRGNDTLRGGPGRDRLHGGRGNDRILALDGRKDVVNCGAGRDRVRADRFDRLRRCEHGRRR